MARLLALFVLLPALELALLIEIGSRIGTLATLALIALTGAIGASLARQQGLGVLNQMRGQSAQGRIPAAPVVDGVLILLAGALLITPGVLTDAFGFFCLIPACRRLLKSYLKRRLQRAVQQGNVWVSVDMRGDTNPYSSRRPMRNVTPQDPSGEEKRLDP